MARRRSDNSSGWDEADNALGSLFSDVPGPPKRSIEEIVGLPPSRPMGPPTPISTTMDEVEPRELAWLWEGVVPRGKLTLLTGAPDAGKSLVALDIAARLSRGGPFPGDFTPFVPGGTLLITAGDDLADTVRPRLEAAGADLMNITTWQAVEQWYTWSDRVDDPERLDLRRDLGSLVREISGVVNCQLVVIDPISAFLPPSRINKAEKAPSVLARLAEIAQQSQVAVIAVANLNNTANDPRRRMPSDNLGLFAAARGAWAIIRDPGSEVRRMLPIKQNLRAPSGGLAFCIASDSDARPRLHWEQRGARRLVAGGFFTPVFRQLGGVNASRLEHQPALPLLEVRALPAPPTHAQQQIVALIRKRGGQITARALMRSNRHYRTAGQAQAALADLVAAGLVTQRMQPPGRCGGRAVEVFETAAQES
jgi:hypothetical protein